MAHKQISSITITTNTKVSKEQSQNSNLKPRLEGIQVKQSKHDQRAKLRGDETPKVSSLDKIIETYNQPQTNFIHKTSKS